MRLTVLTAVTAVLVFGVIVELLRRRQLREKYAVLWMVTALAVVALGAFPTLLDSVSRLVGVASGASLDLFLGIVFLLMVSIHLSWEASRLEEKTRTLAEELALLRDKISADGQPVPNGRGAPTGQARPARPVAPPRQVGPADREALAGRETAAGPGSLAGRENPAERESPAGRETSAGRASPTGQAGPTGQGAVT